ncbi:hypothetical protein ACNSOL_11555 (plasmid) [Aliarcobacter lanthieri]|uniref:hypothetical protein n=1 Tax=Aliarcobacter lanthieri TaxID=1355374 RepID=UPI003AB0524F
MEAVFKKAYIANNRIEDLINNVSKNDKKTLLNNESISALIAISITFLVLSLHFDYITCTSNSCNPVLGYSFLEEMGYKPIFYSLEEKHLSYVIEIIFTEFPAEILLWLIILLCPIGILIDYIEDEKDVIHDYIRISVLCIWGLGVFMFYIMRF